MNLAWISLAALILAITLSMVTSVNVGVVSLAMAWIVGVYMGGMPVAKVIGAFRKAFSPPLPNALHLSLYIRDFGLTTGKLPFGEIELHLAYQCVGHVPLLFPRRRAPLFA